MINYEEYIVLERSSQNNEQEHRKNRTDGAPEIFPVERGRPRAPLQAPERLGDEGEGEEDEDQDEDMPAAPPEFDDVEVYGPVGIDKAKFLIRTNPKSEMNEIKKISSGGELCRFALAIKVVSSLNKIKTIVFDEVDSGIGGSVASAVGERLKRLGRRKQIIVVTHSPQVAALGNQHLKVTKSYVDGNNVTRLVSLNSNEKINEIARMLSGRDITPEAELAAKNLINSK